MPYGIANRRGQPSVDEVRGILALAREAGVRVLDTARAYGQSEEVIGSLSAGDSHWRIVTKISPNLSDDEWVIVAEIEASLHRSREALTRQELDTVLLHRPEHLIWGDGAAWRCLLRERNEGTIKRIGVSVLSPEQALQLVTHSEIDSLQVPFNLLDQRLRRARFFQQAKTEGKEVFIRSVFLQGLAFIPDENLDPYFAPLRVPLANLDRWATDHGMTRGGLFLRYAQSQGAHVVVGCESTEQLRQNLATWKLGPLAESQAREVEALLPEISAVLLDPSRWRLTRG
jgi:aryl-alcohol dehydrogenase-like predicted oxidoreductase